MRWSKNKERIHVKSYMKTRPNDTNATLNMVWLLTDVLAMLFKSMNNLRGIIVQDRETETPTRIKAYQYFKKVN